jgi:hypothetical protein
MNLQGECALQLRRTNMDEFEDEASTVPLDTAATSRDVVLDDTDIVVTESKPPRAETRSDWPPPARRPFCAARRRAAFLRAMTESKLT